MYLVFSLRLILCVLLLYACMLIVKKIYVFKWDELICFGSQKNFGKRQWQCEQ